MCLLFAVDTGLYFYVRRNLQTPRDYWRKSLSIRKHQAPQDKWHPIHRMAKHRWQQQLFSHTAFLWKQLTSRPGCLVLQSQRLRRLRKEDRQFKACLGHTERVSASLAWITQWDPGFRRLIRKENLLLISQTRCLLPMWPKERTRSWKLSSDLHHPPWQVHTIN